MGTGGHEFGDRSTRVAAGDQAFTDEYRVGTRTSECQ
ncbi:Uncharacterised protein [Mycobacteroides abscessus subsp. abscessus]|nr:Uncharacterised protein [Mycobacteroides abscessus subsp. abscessus]